MYRLLERIPASPEHARRPARASANERPFIRGETGRGACERRGGTNHRPQYAGRPVTSTGTRRAASIDAALCVSGETRRTSRVGTWPGDENE